MSYNLSVLLEDSARRFPDRSCLVSGGRRLSYAEVEAMANQVANFLVDLGIEPGDRVALTCPNVPEFAVVYYGILKAGAVVVPMNVLNKGREVSYYLNDAEAKVYFCFQGLTDQSMGEAGKEGAHCSATPPVLVLMAPECSAGAETAGGTTLAEQVRSYSREFQSVNRAETDTAVILYTSGTTGRPKGAELTHSNLMMNVLASNRVFESKPASDVHMVALPLFHTFGATVQLNAGFSMAATLVLLPRFDAEQALRTLDEHEITFFAGVPTMWWGLLGAIGDRVDAARIARKLRVGVSGGASLPVAILNEVKERLGIRIIEGYGLSETAPLATCSDPHGESRPGSIGAPLWGVECKLIDPTSGEQGEPWREVDGAAGIGEIAVRGHNVMKGYWNRPEATSEVMRDGWFRTGDLARMDGDGFYYIVDRSKDMIIRGGYNVYPREIEEVLIQHPDVSLAAVVGVPHERLGEEVKAFVIRSQGAVLTEEELVQWGMSQLAAYKSPRIVAFVESLPMTSTGKILKRELV